MWTFRRALAAAAPDIERTMRDAQPSERQGAVFKDGVVREADGPSVGVEFFERHEPVQVVRVIGGNEPLEPDVPDDVDVALEAQIGMPPCRTTSR
jgi:hypothetical protein